MGRQVHSGSRWFTGVGLGIIGFIRFRLGRDKGSSCSFGFAWVHSSTPRIRPVYSRSFGFTQSRLGGVGFSRIRLGSLMLA